MTNQAKERIEDIIEKEIPCTHHAAQKCSCYDKNQRAAQAILAEVGKMLPSEEEIKGLLKKQTVKVNDSMKDCGIRMITN
jgi:hypothetical protein